MLSVRPDRPVDPITVAVMRVIDSLTNELGLPYFVIGAMARDIVITNVFGLSTDIATKDVDFAVAVESWDQYEAIKSNLLKRKKFTPANDDMAHRLYYEHSPGIRYPLDIIPFRGVEQRRHSIAWPPEMKVMMNVAGYEEALETAVLVSVEEGLEIHIASLPGLAVLKLFAWIDRGLEDSKDALDLAVVFRRYAFAGNEDRLYGVEIKALEAVDFDLELAGPRLLGKDVRSIAMPDTFQKITTLLDDARLLDRLVTHMAPRFESSDDSVSTARQMLEQFKAGLLEH